MQNLAWHQAVTGIMQALEIDSENLPSDKHQKINKLIAGAGFKARRIEIAGGSLPEEPGMVGALLDAGEECWIPLVVSDEKVHRIDAYGNNLGPVSITDVQHIKRGWVITKTANDNSQFMSFLRRHKGPLMEIFVCGFIINLFALSLPLFSSFVYDKVLGNGITETLWGLAIGLLIIMVVEFCVRALRALAAERFSINSEGDIDREVIQRLLSSDTKSLPSIGQFLERYKRTLNYRDFLSSSYMMSLVDLPFLVFFLVVIAYAAGPLVFIPITFGVIAFAANFFTTIPVLDYEHKSRNAEENRFRLLTNILTSYESIVGISIKDDLSRKWKKECASTSAAQSKSRYWRSLGNSVSNSLSFLTYVSVIIGGVYMIEDYSLTSGGLLAATMLSSRAIACFFSANNLVLRYKEFQSAMSQLNEILPSIKNDDFISSRGALRGNVFVDKVTCRLGPNNKPALNNISLNIHPGEIVGIVGAPGAGKTTLLRLICGLVGPDEGNVTIDNYPINSLSQRDLSQNIGYKPQELCLMEGTIEYNVVAGRKALSTEDLNQLVISSALIWAFKESGLNWTTEIGPRGTNLSGGQRQLVALARAFWGNPPLLLLDEPTNGLDSNLEAHIAKQLLAKKGKSTIIVSTHSRHILSACDRIIVLGNGQILADGPRDKILLPQQQSAAP